MRKVLFIIMLLFVMPIISLADSYTIQYADGSSETFSSAGYLEDELELGSTIIINSAPTSDIYIETVFNYDCSGPYPSNRTITINNNGYNVNLLDIDLEITNCGQDVRPYLTIKFVGSGTYNKVTTSGNVNIIDGLKTKQLRAYSGPILENVTLSTSSEESWLVGTQINSGTYNMTNACINLWGTTINGGTFTSTSDYLFKKCNSGIAYDGMPIEINGGTFSGGTQCMFNFPAKVTSGTFNGNNSNYIFCDYNTDGVNYSISGGTFNNVQNFAKIKNSFNIENISLNASGILFKADNTTSKTVTIKDGTLKTTTSGKIIEEATSTSSPSIALTMEKGSLTASNSTSAFDFSTLQLGKTTNLDNGSISTSVPLINIPKASIALSGSKKIYFNSGRINLASSITGVTSSTLVPATNYKLVQQKLLDNTYRAFIIPSSNTAPANQAKGDWDNDGVLGISDLTYYRRYIAGSELLAAKRDNKGYSSFDTETKEMLNYDSSTNISLIDLIGARIDLANS